MRVHVTLVRRGEADPHPLPPQHTPLYTQGAWYSYGEEKLGQGRDKAVVALAQKPEWAAAIEAEVGGLGLKGRGGMGLDWAPYCS